MTAPATSSIRQVALADIEHEFASTRRILERVPDAQFAWKPHDKSGALGQLAAHLVQLPRLMLVVLEQDGLDFSKTPPRPPEPATTTAELLERFDAVTARVRAALDAASDEALSASWTLRAGDHVIMSGTRASMMRTMGISHIVHHRGQLSVYLRLLDVPVPGLYGPSADEKGM
jgi:uncharacterized damage-inducible protein DinB